MLDRPSEDEIRRLGKAADMIGAERQYLVTRTRETVVGEWTVSTNLPWMLENLCESAIGRRTG